jgi:allantoate deiminase
VIASHLDTVLGAGRYDGVLGVMLGLAAVAQLHNARTPLPWAIEVIAFSDEEGVRFATPFIGSRALAGTLDGETLSRRDAAGVTMAEVLTDFGADPAGIPDAAVRPGDIVAYLEPHIEQGPVLDSIGAPLAVVSAIAGQSRLTLEWTGQGGHAGTAPMVHRVDALPAACRWTAAVEMRGKETTGLVATVGRIEIDPNVPNCIARSVRTSLDVRHQDDAVRGQTVDALLLEARRLAQESRLEVRVEYPHEHSAILMDERLTDRLVGAIRALGQEPQRLVSGAGHDAGIMAAVAPTAMLFIRSPGGVSHHPDEAVAQSDVATALAAIVRFIQELATE